jgi:hypothetical protein
MTTTPRWRKSSRSAQDTACVELAHTLDMVRDSKNPTGPTLAVNTHRLLTAIKSGGLSRS